MQTRVLTNNRTGSVEFAALRIIMIALHLHHELVAAYSSVLTDIATRPFPVLADPKKWFQSSEHTAIRVPERPKRDH